jgi:hypothetical protein
VSKFRVVRGDEVLNILCVNREVAGDKYTTFVHEVPRLHLGREYKVSAAPCRLADIERTDNMNTGES